MAADPRFLAHERDLAARALTRAQTALDKALAFACPHCGRTLAGCLTQAEARARNGAGTAACLFCRLTDVSREPALSQCEEVL